MNPYLLDFADKVPYFVLMAYTVGDYNKLGCPNPPWFVYRYQHGQWERIPIERLPEIFVQRNLIPLGREIDRISTDNYVDLKELERNWESYPKAQQAKVFRREKVNPIAEGCFGSILIQQGRQSEIDYRR